MNRKTFPFYPLLFGVFPVIALFTYNKFETRLIYILRPLIVVLLFSGLAYAIFYFVFRKNSAKAALVAGVTILLFLSYGHIFNLVKQTDWLDKLIGHHTHVVILFGLFWLVVLFLTLKKEINPDFTKTLNIFSIILVCLPLLQMGWFYLSEAVAHQRAKSNPVEVTMDQEGLNYQPDVYYIILDMFARPDALMETYDIDLSEFIDDMTSMGFYYADESLSNYGETFQSISSALNMDLIGTYIEDNAISLGSAEYRDLLIHNEVRESFENMRYQTIAFSTGYRWSEWADADIYYLIHSIDPLGSLSPFENLLFKSTLIYPFRGYYLKHLPTPTTENYGYVGLNHSLHIETQYNILEKLPEIPINPNPTFTFAHVLIPHVPFIFGADGTLLQDPGYYSAEGAGPINDTYALDGYANQVTFISREIARISQEILDQSANPPIIIIQGDHGWKDDNRHQILNLYYFPQGDYAKLYPSITPVNTFRVILDQFYGYELPPVPDEVRYQETYASDEQTP
jgi:hypothetical protein